MKCTWPTPEFCIGTQRHLYSTDWRRGLASGLTQIPGLASGVWRRGFGVGGLASGIWRRGFGVGGLASGVWRRGFGFEGLASGVWRRVMQKNVGSQRKTYQHDGIFCVG